MRAFYCCSLFLFTYVCPVFLTSVPFYLLSWYCLWVAILLVYEFILEVYFIGPLLLVILGLIRSFVLWFFWFWFSELYIVWWSLTRIVFYCTLLLNLCIYIIQWLWVIAWVCLLCFCSLFAISNDDFNCRIHRFQCDVHFVLALLENCLYVVIFH